LKTTARKVIGTSKAAAQAKKIERLRQLRSRSTELYDFKAAMDNKTPLTHFVFNGHKRDVVYKLTKEPGYSPKAIEVSVEMNGKKVSVVDFDTMVGTILRLQIKHQLSMLGFKTVSAFIKKRDELKTAEGMTRALQLTSTECRDETKQALGMLMEKKFNDLIDSMSAMTSDMTEFSNQMYQEAESKQLLTSIANDIESGSLNGSSVQSTLRLINELLTKK
jgi:hypothetical protein